MRRATQMFVFSLVITLFVIPAFFFQQVTIIGPAAFPAALAGTIALILLFLATAGFIFLLITLVILAVVWIQEMFRGKQRDYRGCN